MQVSLDSPSAIQRRMTIGVPAQEIDSEVDKRLQQTARRVKIPGFRPGKVPMRIIRERYEDSARQEVLGDVIQRSFYEAVVQEKLNPAGAPSVEPKVFEKGKDLEYVATFEVFPEFTVSGLENIEVERLNAQISDQDVDNLIENIRKQNTEFGAVDRPAQNDDRLIIDFVGRIDGEEFAGGKAEGSRLVLGSGRMIPGFEEALVGVKAGEERVINPQFPEDYPNKDLAGKTAEFTVTVKEVAAPQLPEINDEFLARFGITEGGEEAFRKDVRQNMERELKQSIKNKVKNQVMEALLAANPIEAPPALISSEIDRLRAQAAQRFGGSIKPEQLPTEPFKEQARRRVLLGLIVAELVKQFELKPEEAQVEAMIDELATAYQEPEQVKDWYRQNKDARDEIRSVVLEEQVVDTVLGKGTVTDKTVSYEEAVKPAPAPEVAQSEPEQTEQSEQVAE